MKCFNKNINRCLCASLVVVSLFTVCSCKADKVELLETTVKVIVEEKEKGYVTRDKVVTPTIDLNSVFNEKSTRSEIASESESINESTSSSEDTTTESTSEETTVVETTTINPLDLMVDEDDRVFHGTDKIETEGWKYGMTPCEWVYIEPNIQLISNYKPNSSAKYSANGKVRTSSGLKGCYIPVFIKTDMMGNEFDGRFYVFSDYTKTSPETMLFDNSLRTVKYKNMPVEEILRMGFPNIERTDNGLLKLNGEYINIVYVTDLDKILNGNK